MIKVAILGYGTVGSGVYDVIKNNKDVLRSKIGDEIDVKYVLDLRDFPGQQVQQAITHNFDDIINDSEVSVVIETMGGITASYEFVKKSLLACKSVATSNKELVAKYGPELLELARANHVSFLFEASVGGGIPIIRPLNTSLTADHILGISGILNGTTNYILTEMAEKGNSFEQALSDAQALGYAERDPSADVEGYDACRKIAILTSLAYGKTVDYEQIPTEGITKITQKDFAYAQKLGGCIKLLGISKAVDNGVFALVAPAIVPFGHPLCMVKGVFNAITVKGDMLGDTMYYGPGAGKLPTASAVVSDLVDILCHAGQTVPIHWSKEKLPLLDGKNVPVKMLLRVACADISKAQQVCRQLFSSCRFLLVENSDDEFGIVVEQETQGSISTKIDALLKDTSIKEIRNCIRMEG